MSIARNTLLNMAGIGVPVIVSIVTVPLYLHAIGLERYGILSICWIAIAYFALFDFGVGKALSQRMAASLHQPEAVRSALFWTGLTTSTALALVAAFLSFTVAAFALPRMTFETPMIAREAQAALPLLAMVFPTIIIGGALSNTLAAHERFGVINSIEVLSSSAGMAGPVVAAYAWGPELPKMLGMILLSRVLAVIAMAVTCRTVVPVRGFVFPRISQITPLLRYGGWASLSDASTPILSVWDRFAIGMVLGASAVPLYSIPNTLVTRLTLLPAALSRSLFPQLARVDSEEADRIVGRTVSGLAAIMTPLCLMAIIGTWPFLSLWIGPVLAQKVVDLAYIFVPGLWMNALAVVPYTLLLAQRRPHVAAWIHAGQVLPYMGLLYGAMLYGGLTGVAILWTFRAGIDALLFLIFSGVRFRGLRAAAPGLLLICVATSVAIIFPSTSIMRWTLLVALLAAGMLHAWRSAPTPMVNYCREFIAKVRRAHVTDER